MRLRYSGALYDRTAALLTGQVPIEGVELEYTVGPVNELFRRQFDSAEFDASELSASNYLIQCARGDTTFVALPVFPSRVFRHNAIYVNTGAGISRPEDLRGKRMGVPEYLQTANFWARAALLHDYGVRPEELRWVRGSTEKLKIPLPAGIDLVDAPAGRTISDLLDAGEIDALMGPRKPACFVDGSPRVRRLFPDFVAVETEYYRRTGHFPIMHLLAVRREVYERDRSLGRRLYDAFVEAKRLAAIDLGQSVVLNSSLPFQIAHAEADRALLGDDPFAYGVARTRHTMEALAQYVVEQGAAPRTVPIEEAFVPELLDT